MKGNAMRQRRRRPSDCPSRDLIKVDRDFAHIVDDDNDKGNQSNDSLSMPPQLRRAGSSTYDLMFSSFHDSDDSEDVTELTTSDEKWECRQGSSPSSFTTTTIFTTLQLLTQGITADFCKNGLPWEGTTCRSKRAGLSGILYALPALVATTTNSGHPSYDQIMWTVQACLSILADYFYICQDSIWHGIDRYFAIFNIVTIVWRAYVELNWKVVLLAILPVSCYMGANRSKKQMNVEAWHMWHCLWHVTGGPLACLVVYMLHHCPDDMVAVPPLQAWCQSNL